MSCGIVNDFQMASNFVLNMISAPELYKFIKSDIKFPGYLQDVLQYQLAAYNSQLT